LSSRSVAGCFFRSANFARRTFVAPRLNSGTGARITFDLARLVARAEKAAVITS
jgi:hypothetical protein